jgi:hypothetical protein
MNLGMNKKWFTIVLSWRVLLVLVVAAAAWLIPYRPDFAFTALPFEAPAVTQKLPPVIWLHANFDGVLYLMNASQSLLAEPRYFPLFPLLIKLTSLHWGSGQITSWHVWAGILVAQLFFLADLWLFYKLLKLDFSDRITTQTILALLFFPSSFFFVMVYSSSVFLFWVLGAFGFARHQKWWISFVMVGLASVTWLPGILLPLPIFWEWWQSRTLEKQKKLQPQILLWLGVVAGPLLTLVLANQVSYGDPLKFLHSQGELHNGRSTSQIVLPFITAIRYLKILITLSPKLEEWWIALLEILTAVWASVALILNWRLKLRPSYQLYALLVIALPLLSGTFSGFPRYILLAFPFWITLGHVPKKYFYPLAAAMFLLQIALLCLFVRGYYVA